MSVRTKCNFYITIYNLVVTYHTRDSLSTLFCYFFDYFSQQQKTLHAEAKRSKTKWRSPVLSDDLQGSVFKSLFVSLPDRGSVQAAYASAVICSSFIQNSDHSLKQFIHIAVRNLKVMIEMQLECSVSAVVFHGDDHKIRHVVAEMLREDRCLISAENRILIAHKQIVRRFSIVIRSMISLMVFVSGKRSALYPGQRICKALILIELKQKRKLLDERSDSVLLLDP